MLRTAKISCIAALVAIFMSSASASIAAELPEAESRKPTSKDTTERSESGAPIYRHAERQTPFIPPKHSTRHLEEIEAHVERNIGKIEAVLHEVVSDLIHLDVLFVKATPERPYHVLVTSGVSDKPMSVPESMEEHSRVELLIALPKEWPLTQESFKSEKNYWPVRWLKQIGRLPHEYDTWVGWGHTIPNGDPAEPIANTKFVGVMLSPPYSLPAKFFQLTTNSGNKIRFYALIPLYQEEMDFKLKRGANALEVELEKQDIDFIVNPSRSNVIKKNAWFN